MQAAKLSAQMLADSDLLGHKLGVRDSIDVLKSQSDLTDILQRLSRARYNVLMAQLRLKASVGGLGYADIVDIDSQLSG